MHSNFITPPDFVQTVLIRNATEEQITQLNALIKTSGTPYNVYFYDDSMNNRDWFDLIKSKADVVLDADLASPLEYFNK